MWCSLCCYSSPFEPISLLASSGLTNLWSVDLYLSPTCVPFYHLFASRSSWLGFQTQCGLWWWSIIKPGKVKEKRQVKLNSVKNKHLAHACPSVWYSVCRLTRVSETGNAYAFVVGGSWALTDFQGSCPPGSLACEYKLRCCYCVCSLILGQCLGDRCSWNVRGNHIPCNYVSLVKQ